MNYSLLKEVIKLIEGFESHNASGNYSHDVRGFKEWIYNGMGKKGKKVYKKEPEWEGKDKGRTVESVISTLIVHMNRYARSYSKSAIYGSDFSTQDEFIYLINLQAMGPMTKMELIKKNLHDKPTGMQIIARLIQQGWVSQQDSSTDKRSIIIRISSKGQKILEQQMGKIRQATKIVTGDLSEDEKMELVRLLNKLDKFHHQIFTQNFGSSELLEKVTTEYLPTAN
ncbi:MAG: MarR family transcriptional regulator [Bacteroidetes bacterium]|nr:MAG: MarR family transcriptional regulator [Bacteroidota bacterium]